MPALETVLVFGPFLSVLAALTVGFGILAISGSREA
jgi:hypothetical protein